MADTNPFAGVRRLLSPTYWLELPEITWRPVFALELEHDSDNHSELHNERLLVSIAARFNATGVTDGAGMRELRDLDPDQMRTLLNVQREVFEVDRRLYPTVIIKGWRNAPPGPDGEPLAFTPELCAMLFDPENGMTDKVFEKIRQAAKNPANFGIATPAPAVVEAASGNS
jgi:hypothetical protein